MVSVKMARFAKEKFINKYWNQKYADYINGVGISRVGTCDKKASEEDEKDDYCIRVLLRKPLPDDMVFPSTYYGVRIFTVLGGEIRPQVRKS